MKTKTKTAYDRVPIKGVVVRRYISRHQKVTPRQRVFSAVAFHSYRLLVRGEKTHDIRLLALTRALGNLAETITYKAPPTEVLQRIAGYAAGWAETLFVDDVFTQIHAERERQLTLLKTGKLLFNCDSLVVDPARKLRVLMEEAGEVAKAIDDLEQAAAEQLGLAFLKLLLSHELVQVAAVCVAWLESLEEAKS